MFLVELKQKGKKKIKYNEMIPKEFLLYPLDKQVFYLKNYEKKEKK